MLFRKKTKHVEVIDTIFFVCDAGMGSSALGASLLSRQLQQHNIQIRVKNAAVDEIPPTAQKIVTHHNFAPRIRKDHEQARIFEIHNFMEKSQYERIVEELMGLQKQKKEILELSNIKLNCKAADHKDAIVQAGKLLVQSGYVREGYIAGMLRRDASLTTYIGNDIAIPHGEYDVKEEVMQTGIVVMIYPEGIDWEGNLVRIVIGIGALNDAHMNILANIATKLGDMEVVDQVVCCQSAETIHRLLTSEDEL